MMALTGVRTLARRISPVVRTGASGTLLTRPSATRSATSPAVSPLVRSVTAVSASTGADGTRTPRDRLPRDRETWERRAWAAGLMPGDQFRVSVNT